MKKSNFAALLLTFTFSMANLAQANDYQTEFGVGYINMDLGDNILAGTDADLSSIGIAGEHFFETVSPTGPFALASFLSKSSRIGGGYFTGDYDVSGVKFDESILSVGGTAFVNENLGLGLHLTNIKSDDLDLSINSTDLDLSFYTDENTAIIFGFTSDGGDADATAFRIGTTSLIDNGGMVKSVSSTIEMNSDDDISADWTTFEIAGALYPTNDKSIGLELGTATGDVQDYVDVGIFGSIFFSNNSFIDLSYTLTSNDISDDISSFFLAYSMRI